MIFPELRKAVCEGDFSALEKKTEEFAKTSKKDRNKITIGDISRGMCLEDIVNYDTLTAFVLLDFNQRVRMAVNVSLACGSPYEDNVVQIWENKEKLYSQCTFEYEVSVETYMKVMHTIPFYYGGMTSQIEDLQNGIIHVNGLKVKMNIKHDKI